MSTPVSVVCPTFNRSRAIERTLTSVLEQEHGDLELLVGSDGSTDDTDDVVRAVAARDPRVRLVPMPHRGDPGPVRADLARRARHDVLAYVDHDDTWQPDHLRTALPHLDEHDAVVLGATYRDADGTETVAPAAAWHGEVGVLDPYAEPTRVVHRRRALDAAGGWGRGRFGLEDWDLWWRMARTGTAFLPVDAATTTVALAPASRRWSVPERAVVVLASATSAPAAQHAVEAWDDGRAGDALDALRDDAAAWADALATDPSTVTPAAARERTAPDPDAVRGTWLARPRVHAGGTAGWLVVLAAPIVAALHRREAHDLLVRRFPGYLGSARSWFGAQPHLSPVKETAR